MPYVPNEGELANLDDIKTQSADSWSLHLFVDDIAENTVNSEADLTEADFDGYAADSNLSWSAPATNGANEAEMTDDGKQFTCTGNMTPNTVYGYYLKDSGGKLRLVHRFDDGPYTMDTNGQTIDINLSYVIVDGSTP